MPDRAGENSLSEALAFLAGHPHAYLLTRQADGFPTAYAMTARVDDGCVLFSTYRASAKVVNLLREGVARVVSAGLDGDTTVVEVGGPVRLVESDRWLEGAAAPSGAPLPPGIGPVSAEIADHARSRHETGQRVVVELRATHARVARAPQ